CAESQRRAGNQITVASALRADIGPQGQRYSLKSMKTLLLLAALLSSQPAFAAAPSAFAETQEQHDARMKWWREARFGMFVHWGLYSGLAGTWDGKPVATSGGMEWIQQRVKADTATYAARAIPMFKPKQGFARE